MRFACYRRFPARGRRSRHGSAGARQFEINLALEGRRARARDHALAARTPAARAPRQHAADVRHHARRDADAGRQNLQRRVAWRFFRSTRIAGSARSIGTSTASFSSTSTTRWRTVSSPSRSAAPASRAATSKRALDGPRPARCRARHRHAVRAWDQECADYRRCTEVRHQATASLSGVRAELRRIGLRIKVENRATPL